MDNLTHSLVGALIGQAGLKRRTGLAMPALILGANLPDIDATCVILGTRSLELRRGLTHGPIAWLLLPLVLSAILYGFDRWQSRRGTRPDDRQQVRFGWLYALTLIACLTHPALDWLNTYGIRLLAPFSQRWFYGDALFIIDVWLWLILGVAIWLSRRRERHAGNWRIPARIGMAAALLYIGANIGLSRAEAQIALKNNAYSRVAIANPVPLRVWRREVILGNRRGYWLIGDETHGDIRLKHCDLETAAAENAEIAAFLFWSRAPFVERAGQGWLLRDARFTGFSGGSFSVPLAFSVCRPRSG